MTDIYDPNHINNLSAFHSYDEFPDWIKDVTVRLHRMLKIAKIPMKLITVAKSGTVYYEFPENDHLGKLRIGNHRERKQYGYRWQIRSDIKIPRVVENKGHKQFLYNPEKLFEMANHIINYDRKAKKRIERKNFGNEVASMFSRDGNPSQDDYDLGLCGQT